MDARGRRGQSLPKLDVAGSSPVARSLEAFPRFDFGRRGVFSCPRWNAFRLPQFHALHFLSPDRVATQILGTPFTFEELRVAHVRSGSFWYAAWVPRMHAAACQRR